METNLKNVAHLYLGAKCITEFNEEAGLNNDDYNHLDVELLDYLYRDECAVKLILRPLSTLQEEELDELGDIMEEYHIGYNDHYDDCDVNKIDWITQPYIVVEQLLRWHFDVFDLIYIGLAIDINTLK